MECRDGSTPSGDSAHVATSPDYSPGIRGKEVLEEHANRIEANSSTQGKEPGRTVKAKRKDSLEVQPNPIQPRIGNTSANHEPSHEEIRRRAYEIYLEHGSHPGNELGDWLQAERELQKVARFTEDWNRRQQQRGADSGDEN
jgi:hypothetical protein